MLPRVMIGIIVCGCAAQIACNADKRQDSGKELLAALDTAAQPGNIAAGGQPSIAQAAWDYLHSLHNLYQNVPGTTAYLEEFKNHCRHFHITRLRERLGSKSTNQIAVNKAILELIVGWSSMLRYYDPFIDTSIDAFTARTRITDSRWTPAAKLLEYRLPSESKGGPVGLTIGVNIRLILAPDAAGSWRICHIAFGNSPDWPTTQPAQG
ncbi:MAG: hypothetical protein HJJLKODD_02905 [Phycisphaerae bacterium]|nr:hypothetical protein [Phycisphaerae bacterium]